MKTLLTLAIVLLLAQSIQAQIPNPVQDPRTQTKTLKEWWKTDGMYYGADGMTWLDNFYNGAGALVISTPSGVQTWQLRYPWDTVNVFTWTGGSAVIRTGDFNGDGLTDYVDGYGYLYIGQTSSLPKSPIRAYTEATRLTTVLDLNDDGIDDILLLRGNYNRVDMNVHLGDTTSTPLANVNVNLGTFFDSSRTVVGVYSLPGHKHRMVLRHAPYYYDSHDRAVFTHDALELYELKWLPDSSQIKLTLLKSLIVKEGFRVWQSGCIFQPNDSTVYRIQAERFDPGDFLHYKTNLVVYRLDDDKITKVASARLDSIASVIPTRGGIDTSDANNILVQKQDARTVEVLSGNFSNGIISLGTSSFCCSFKVCMATPLNRHEKGYVCGGGTYYISGEPNTCFGVNGILDTVSSVNNLGSDSHVLSMRVLPNPLASKKDFSVELVSVTGGVFKLVATSMQGKELVIVEKLIVTEGLSTQKVVISDELARGAYTLQLVGTSIIARCPLIIE